MVITIDLSKLTLAQAASLLMLLQSFYGQAVIPSTSAPDA